MPPQTASGRPFAEILATVPGRSPHSPSGANAVEVMRGRAGKVDRFIALYIGGSNAVLIAERAG